MDLRGDLKGFGVAELHLFLSVVEQNSTYWVKPNYLLDWGMGMQFPSLPSITSVCITEK